MTVLNIMQSFLRLIEQNVVDLLELLSSQLRYLFISLKIKIKTTMK